jgi:hypothetical protein
VAIFGQLREEVTVIELASAKPLGWGGLTDEVGGMSRPDWTRLFCWYKVAA